MEAELKICDVALPNIENLKAPFFQIVGLSYYDGVTDLVARCEGSSKAYRLVLVGWDDDQENRLFSVTELPESIFVAIVSAFEGVPKWPVWIPNRNDEDALSLSARDEQIDKLTRTTDVPFAIVKTDDPTRVLERAWRVSEPIARLIKLHADQPTTCWREMRILLGPREGLNLDSEISD